MPEPVIEAVNIDYTYPDGTRALRQVSLCIERGRSVAVIGGNGAGKSTLALALNGILKPAGGRVLHHGQPVDYSRKGLLALRKSVGLVFQDPEHQLFSASVYQDVSFGPMNMKLPEAEVRRRVDSALENTGILHLKDRPAHSLSFGQKKRVAIAGVLAMEPELMVLDEPTAGLDPAGATGIMKLLKKMRRELGLSLLISTHDVDLVPLYCDYVYVMNNGAIVFSGSPGEVFSRPDVLRSVQLRLPRIAHLAEILQKKDNFVFDENPATIGAARRVLKKWRDREIGREKGGKEDA